MTRFIFERECVAQSDKFKFTKNRFIPDAPLSWITFMPSIRCLAIDANYDIDAILLIASRLFLRKLHANLQRFHT